MIINSAGYVHLFGSVRRNKPGDPSFERTRGNLGKKQARLSTCIPNNHNQKQQYQRQQHQQTLQQK